MPIAFLLRRDLSVDISLFRRGLSDGVSPSGTVDLTAPIMQDRKFMKKYANLLPLGRLGWPEDIAGPATFLASPDADYVTGVLLFVDGGQLA